jgi:two-component system response regulator HydG
MEASRTPRRQHECGEGLDVFSNAMRRLVIEAERVARYQSTVLITGESGVGKERLAQFLHRHSPRALAPFRAVNCGALADSLIDSELFGHVRGAFTGATQDRPGLFESANAGTLFLDEVGELPQQSQVKLLRVLQEREVRRVGDNRERPIDVRVIAATHRDLAKDVTSGRFRDDLYYRLQVVELWIPPLRDRLEDLRGLALALLDRIARRLKVGVTSYSTQALDAIVTYAWPGNVRELENVIERACVVTADEVIDVDDLPERVKQRTATQLALPGIRPLPEVEREHILAALRRNGGNRSETAKQLRIGQSTLFRKLKQYAIAS